MIGADAISLGALAVSLVAISLGALAVSLVAFSITMYEQYLKSPSITLFMGERANLAYSDGMKGLNLMAPRHSSTLAPLTRWSCGWQEPSRPPPVPGWPR